MVTMRPFDRDDWYAFAGAEEPAGGEPQIGEVALVGPGWMPDDLANPTAVVVVDRTGMSINGYESIWSLQCGFEVGMILTEHLPNPITIETLLKWKFDQIS